MIFSKRSLGALGVAAMLLASCSLAVDQVSTQLTPGSGKSFRLNNTVEVRLSTGYSTVLRAGTRWELIGTIPQGEVYRTRDQIVTLEGAHVHEGYIVVKQGTLTGFYLPVERAFSQVAPEAPLSTLP